MLKQCFKGIFVTSLIFSQQTLLAAAQPQLQVGELSSDSLSEAGASRRRTDSGFESKVPAVQGVIRGSADRPIKTSKCCSHSSWRGVRNFIVSWIVAPIDGWIVYPFVGQFTLDLSARAYDKPLIDKLNNFVAAEIAVVPEYLARDFPSGEGLERDAAHSLWTRLFIEDRQLPSRTQAMIKKLNTDQRWVAMSYLSAIDRGQRVTKNLLAGYYGRIALYANDFIAAADEAEQEYRAMRAEGLPSHFIKGDRLRPLVGNKVIKFGPKFWRHPVTALMLAEFRRVLLPKEQVKVDRHFHELNLKSRTRAVKDALSGDKMITTAKELVVTAYTKEVPIEFYVSRTETKVEAYLTSIQGEANLTTTAQVTSYAYSDGRVLYLLKYHDFKNRRPSEKYTIKYLISDIIPIGAVGETYLPGLSEEEALARISHYPFKSTIAPIPDVDERRGLDDSI